jgi:methanogenic corrinoid protein MtbC1
VGDFLRLIETRSLDAAAEFVITRLDAGDSPQRVITALLAPAQAEVGERWHRGRWTPAEVHQATAVTDLALHRLAGAARRPATRDAIAVVCAEGDWHTMPARMAAELLRLDGWDVTFLGGSLPAADLARWLRDARPDGLVVSCSMPTYASGVRAIGNVATQFGIPVVAGGRGMGRDGRRAAALGVGWARDIGDVGAALAVPWAPIDYDRIGQRQAASYTIALRRAEIVDGAMVELASIWAPMQSMDRWQLARTAEDFGYILDFAAATILLDDPRVFTEFIEWLTVLLDARGVTPETLDLGLHALLSAIPPDLTAARGVIAAATQDRSAAT